MEPSGTSESANPTSMVESVIASMFRVALGRPLNMRYEARCNIYVVEISISRTAKWSCCSRVSF